MPSVSVTNLRCEYLTDPVAIDDPHPRLSWELEAAGLRGVLQRGYRILVASDLALLKKGTGDVWDTGRVESDATCHIAYGGRRLVSFKKYYWKVMVWIHTGDRASAWSKTATWGMGILNQRQWKGQWAAYPVANLHDSPYLRTVFTVKKKVTRAVLYATAKGLYEAHLNGTRVGEDLFAPGWTDYKKRICYNAYDVTRHVKKGKNALGAVLGEGWFKGPIAWVNQQLSYGGHIMFLANLRIEYADGSTETVATDKEWKTSTGPILQSTFLWGETYDSRRELAGWDTARFNDGAWQDARMVPLEKGDDAPLLQASPHEPVRRHELMKPKKMWQAPRGSWVFDLGQNFAGRAILKVREKAGTVVRLRFGEMVNDDRTLYVENLRTAWSTDTYVCSGNGVETWEPRFTFHGFRYVEITGVTRKPSLDTVTGVVISSATPRVGNFSCSDAMVNKLYSNALWTQRSNFIDVPTDCPQRDERLGWTGDAQVYIRTAAASMDVAAFFKKWLVDLEDTQQEDGAVLNVAPAPVMKFHKADAGWGDAMVICPWVLYNVYGDTRILAKHFDAMKKWVAYLESTSKNLVRGQTHTFGDWLAVGGDTPTDMLQTAFFAYATDLTARSARVLEREKDAGELETLHRNILRAFNRRFVDAKGRVKGRTQTAYLLALQFDLLPEKLRPAAVRHLVADIRKRGTHLGTGFLGTPFLLEVLQRFGHTDLAYTLLTNRTYPSWGYSIENGATTIWERWNSYTKEHGFGNTNMNSFSHYAYGSVVAWMFKTVAGVDLAAPGFREIDIRPVPGGGITHAEASYQSISGPVAVGWKRTRTQLALEVTVPVNTRANIHLPGVEPAAVTESGVPLIESAGILHAVAEPDGTVVQAGSGTYRFTAKLTVS